MFMAKKAAKRQRQDQKHLNSFETKPQNNPYGRQHRHFKRTEESVDVLSGRKMGRKQIVKNERDETEHFVVPLW